MNAYELAEKLEYDYWHAKANITMFKSADMLRQQADRIAELDKELNHMRSFFGCDPEYYGMTSAEPVAWMQTWENQDGKKYHTIEWTRIGNNDIPLYTHPAKTLTDEEIQDCMGCLPKYNSEIVDEDLVKFAKAILRKAQEK